MAATTERITLVQFARLNGLSWGQAWRRVLRNEVPAEQVQGKWYVEVPASVTAAKPESAR